jgi:hypothetical protein
MEPPGGDADDRERTPVEPDRRPDDVSIGMKRA